MNTADFSKNLDQLLPYLIDTRKKHYKNLEEKRIKFVEEYTIEKVKELTLDEYILGKGDHSYCWNLEYGLIELGKISSPINKYGIYFNQNKNDYIITQKWGNDIHSAFVEIRRSIVELLSHPDDYSKLIENELSTLIKGKLLFLYYPEQFLSIYSDTHLNHIVSHLNILTKGPEPLHLQAALMELRSQFITLRDQSPFLYADLLYRICGFPPKEKNNIPIIRTAINGAKRIERLAPSSESHSKVNYVSLQKELKEIGDRGELIIYQMEKDYLRDNGYSDLSEKVEHTASLNDKAGFDILSYELSGEKKYIEVKSTKSKKFNNGFYITLNEIEKSKELGNYYLYLVSNVMSEAPEVYIYNKPSFEDGKLILKPILFNVRIQNM
jgi:hypothetical protein